MKIRLGRTLALSAASVVGIIAVTAGPALADDCVNLSRNTDSAQAMNGAKTLATPFGSTFVKGSWVYLGDTWLSVPGVTKSQVSPR